MALNSGLCAASCSITTGPRSDPFVKPAAEVRLKPDICIFAPWHCEHLVAKTGRMFFSKNSSCSADCASNGAAAKMASRVLILGYDSVCNRSGHVGQAKVTAGIAVGKFFMFETHQVENRGVQIVDVHAIFLRVIAELVCGPVDESGFHS